MTKLAIAKDVAAVLLNVDEALYNEFRNAVAFAEEILPNYLLRLTEAESLLVLFADVGLIISFDKNKERYYVAAVIFGNDDSPDPGCQNIISGRPSRSLVEHILLTSGLPSRIDRHTPDTRTPNTYQPNIYTPNSIAIDAVLSVTPDNASFVAAVASVGGTEFGLPIHKLFGVTAERGTSPRSTVLGTGNVNTQRYELLPRRQDETLRALHHIIPGWLLCGGTCAPREPAPSNGICLAGRAGS